MIEIYECSGCKHWAQDDEVPDVGKCTNVKNAFCGLKNTFCGRWTASDAACENYEGIKEEN